MTVQTLYAQASDAVGAATDGESTRATSAESLRQHLTQAQAYTDLILLRLKGQNANNLAQLEGWGFSTTVGKRGINIHKPTKPNGIIAFLRAYVAKERTLVEGQQITDPALDVVTELLNALETDLGVRTRARNQRERNIETRSQVLDELLNWLQVAAGILVMQHGGRVSSALQEHGYTVVQRMAPVKVESSMAETLS